MIMAQFVQKVFSFLKKYFFYILSAVLAFTLYITLVVIVERQDLNTANDLPCEYFDSMNITGGLQLRNDYIFQNLVFPKGRYATVNSKLEFSQANDSAKFVRVSSYQRGCLNETKKYIRLCSEDVYDSSDFDFVYSKLQSELNRWNLTKYTETPFEYIVETCGRTNRIDEKSVWDIVNVTDLNIIN